MRQSRTVARGERALPGRLVAAVTALVSGISVFVNSYGVHSLREPSVYTTAKNLVAALILGGCLLAGRAVRSRRDTGVLAHFLAVAPGSRAEHGAARLGPRELVGLAYVGIVGGGIAFVLFFDGLAKTSATPAAFLKDTLVIWVALLAVPLLRERLRPLNVAAIGLLVAGQIAILKGVGHLAADRGQELVLASTLCWAVEVVVVKKLLRGIPPGVLALTRMGVGAVALVVYLAASGSLGALGRLDARQFGWVLLTGALLATYVGTWMTALARARALDVTSILVASALVTALLQAAAGTAALAPQALGLALIAAGAGTLAALQVRDGARELPEQAGP